MGYTFPLTRAAAVAEMEPQASEKHRAKAGPGYDLHKPCVGIAP